MTPQVSLLAFCALLTASASWAFKAAVYEHVPIYNVNASRADVISQNVARYIEIVQEAGKKVRTFAVYRHGCRYTRKCDMGIMSVCTVSACDNMGSTQSGSTKKVCIWKGRLLYHFPHRQFAFRTGMCVTVCEDTFPYPPGTKSYTLSAIAYSRREKRDAFFPVQFQRETSRQNPSR